MFGIPLNVGVFISSLENGKRLDIVHNYGHGGTGVTISYGCAIEVANIAGEIMKSRNTKSKL